MRGNRVRYRTQPNDTADNIPLIPTLLMDNFNFEISKNNFCFIIIFISDNKHIRYYIPCSVGDYTFIIDKLT